MKQTSIEFLADQLKFTHKEAYNDLYEVIQQAKEMHKQEMASNCSQLEISDEEIEKAKESAWSDYEYQEGNLYSTTFSDGWKMAIKWYREQLKQL